MKNAARIGVAVVVALLVAGLLWFQWERDRPRRVSIETLQTLARALNSSRSENLLSSIQLPESLRNRTTAEQVEFITKALRDEISPEGLAVLRRHGKFGALTDLFPVEAKTWAEQAGVKPEACVGFRMERDNIRAEVVLVREGEAYRVVRCNNVKQLAAAKL